MSLTLTIDQQLNLLDLYQPEILSRLQNQHYSIDSLKHLVETQKLHELYEDAIHSGNWPEFGRKLWIELRHSPMNKVLYNAILAFLSEIDFELHKLLNLSNYEHEFVVGFKRLLKHSPDILKVMDFHRVMGVLEDISSGFSEVIEPIKVRVHEGKLDVDRAKALLLRSIPIMGSDSFEHFLYALKKTSPEGENLIQLIYPGFDRNYAELQAGLTPRGIIHIVNTGDSIWDVIQAARNEGKKSKYALDLRFKNISEIHTRPCWIDTTKEEPLNLRSYQTELAEKALQDHNVIICAPTNSGKTIVAAYIIRQHIYEHIRSKKPFKICFFVPTNSILAQQYEVMEKYLGHCAKVTKLSGEDQAPIRETIANNDVIIIIHQLIINLIEEKPIEGFDNFELEPFCLSTFSMLIFDEAHHTDEYYPYNIIMNYYHDLKATKAFKSSKSLPQIIGLTASLGVGKSKTIEDAVNHLIKKCANLDTTCVSRVLRYKDQLFEFTARARDHIELCGRSFKNSAFYLKLADAMQVYETSIFGIEEAKHISVSTILNKDKFDLDYYKSYGNWLFNLEKNICSLSTGTLSVSSHQIVMTSIQKLKIFYKAVEFLRLFTSGIALKFLVEEFSRAVDKNVQDVIRDLRELEQKVPFTSDILQTLFTVLRRHFPVQDNDGRVIIFLNLRDYAIKLAELINYKFPSIKADFITGVTKSTEQGGTTPESLRMKLKDFNEGAFKILCSTSVSEEGLDIAKCNLVIKYSYVTNEIANVQRRGRGRDINSRCILITDDKSEKEQEQRNIEAEHLMMDALEVLNSMPNVIFQLKIDEKRKELYKKREEDRASVQEKSQELKGLSSKFKILCKMCANTICEGPNLKTYKNSQYLVIDMTFWKKVKTERIPDNEVGREKTPFDVGRVDFPLILALLHSKTSKWPTMWRFLGSYHEHQKCKLTEYRLFKYFPILLVQKSSLDIMFEETFEDRLTGPKRFMVKKWKQVTSKHFKPEELTGIDLKIMQDAAKKPEYQVYVPPGKSFPMSPKSPDSTASEPMDAE